MISFEMEDLIGVLQGLTPYLVAIGLIIVAAIAISIAVKGQLKERKSFTRTVTWLGALASIAVIVNLICFGPMSTLISLVSGGGQVSQETTDEASAVALDIAEEGFVLLENEDATLPLSEGAKLNLFGWASTNPIYGGAGSGGINDLFPVVSLIDGLEEAGFEVNQDLVDFYLGYAESRAAVSITAQNWDLPEPPASTYTDELIAGAQGFSNTAVIVISRLAGEGHTDIPQDMSQAVYQNNSESYADFEAGGHYLQLSRSEADMVDLVCRNFDDVIVVYNGAYAFELGFVEDYPQIKALIWTPGPGNVGFTALGEILAGTVNPSGKTNDTFVYDIDSAPYYNNAEKTDYANMLDMTVEGMNAGVPTNYSPAFINYVENIYVGYKFYETADAEGIIDYDATIQYPFGYGLSYTSFTQEMGEISESNGTISFDVTVTNTGSQAGKDTVEVYFNPPYTNGGIEKASANLVRYDKTKLLEPGASQTITISFPVEDMASYDEDGAGCYVLEAGDYVISINADAHTVLDSRTYTVGSTITYDESNPRASDDVAAVNRLQDAQGDVVFLSRADRFANYAEATAAPSNLDMPEEYVVGYHLNASYDPAAYIDPDAEMPTTGAEGSLTIYDVRGLDYDDPLWDSLLDQLTIDEMAATIALAGYQTPAIESIGKVQNVDCDGPAAINNNFTGAGSIGFPIEVVITCTWNHDLAYSWGEMMGKMSREMNATGWYAPALNTHRSAFTARNYEYFSEDGVLAGWMAADAVRGAHSQGVYSTIKHFAMYDSNGKMVCAWATEQSMREIYLKPFEIAVKEGGADAAMESWAFIGNKWVGEISVLNNDILRGEWGFCGFIVSDFFRNNGHGFMNADMALANGVDAMLSTFEGGPNQVSDKAAASNVQYMRTAMHNILYTTANSWAYDGSGQGGVERWKMAFYVADAVIAAVVIGGIAMAVRKRRAVV
ncbi:beta-glucosidase [Coriobacteriales bacterium OH1046]|nr:beta-glucosidase [Coriobacteriales bacterium OH1046]